MVKKYGLWYAVKYYSIIPFAVLALVLYIANPFIFAYTCNALGITERSGFYMPYKLLIAVALIAAWFMIVFSSCRSKRYKYLTGGRSFGKDSGKYKRSYYELVEYF